MNEISLPVGLIAGARVVTVNGVETAGEYGHVAGEHVALKTAAGVLDLSCRGRVCLTGADRVRFLHGQVTNDIRRLRPGEGCYAALVTAKGRMQSDLTVYCLADELLLDFEPGLSQIVRERLEKYIVADDVQVTDVAPLYGLLSVQGPKAVEVIQTSGIANELPSRALGFVKVTEPLPGEVYICNQARVGGPGFDVFVPVAGMAVARTRLVAAATALGGRACGWTALELARIEAGIPRFGADMDETCFPQECGIEDRAVSYSKGCYIGQEVLNRIHTMGHVNRTLRGLRFAGETADLPQKGAKLLHEGKEAGVVTSVAASGLARATIGLGLVRREAAAPGTEVIVGTGKDARRCVVTEPGKSVA